MQEPASVEVEVHNEGVYISTRLGAVRLGGEEALVVYDAIGKWLGLASNGPVRYEPDESVIAALNDQDFR